MDYTGNSAQVKAVYLDAAHTILKLARPYPDMLLAAFRRFGISRTEEEVQNSLLRCWAASESDFAGMNGDFRMNDDIDRAMWHNFYRSMMADLRITDHPDELLDEIYMQFAVPSNWALYPETLETIVRLKERGMIVGVGSNWDSRLPAILRYLEVLDHLDCIVVSAIIGYRKPAREFFEAECAAAGLPAEQILHVGDHPVADVEGAVSAGLRSVLVWRKGAPPALPPGVPVIDSLLGVLDHLG